MLSAEGGGMEIIMKRIFCYLLITLLFMSLAGCSSANYSTFELGDKKYDLSGDMNETIAKILNFYPYDVR